MSFFSLEMVQLYIEEDLSWKVFKQTAVYKIFILISNAIEGKSFSKQPVLIHQFEAVTRY